MAAVEKQADVPTDSNLGAKEGISSPSSSSIGDTGINEKSLLRKLDYLLLPPLTLLYLLSFLDRSNVGNARLEGMATDIKMSLMGGNHIAGNQYLTGLTLYFIGYVLFEIPCNVVLKKTTPRIWLPTLTLVWGVVATLLGVVQNYPGYLASR